ncbi:hypothetical protein Bca101_023818 [Brassica carinata]
MGESYELEEGEFNCSANVDLDVDLSYIDKKIQNVLGHFQKKVELGSLDMFGPKVNIYGSFLPTYKRLPVVPPPCQRSSMGNSDVQRFPNILPVKSVVQKFQSLATDTSCKSASIQDSLLPQAPRKVTIKKEDARVPGNDSSDHKPIRVRIKMGSKILSQKVTMVCNDLGLDDSPNSPIRNSHDDRSRMLPHTSLEKTSESPSRILQEMTAIPVPEDLLMSPLPHSLLILKEKEKPVKVPFIQTQNKFSDVGVTPSGRKRKAVDCFNATTTLNETSSIGEVKKQKVSSAGPLARESSTCGLGGINSTSDGFTTKSNLQKGIKKDVEEGDPRVAFAKSNKMKVVGKHAEKEKKTYPIKLKQKSSYGDKVLSKMPSKDTANKVDFALAPSSTSLDNDIWAECDTCKTWRLLPFGVKHEKLPDKWVCSMQTWLPCSIKRLGQAVIKLFDLLDMLAEIFCRPEMNHCGVSEEETTNAVKSINGTKVHGPETSNADKSYHQSLTSGSLPNLIETKPQGVSSNILVDAAKPTKSTSHMLRIKNIKLPLKTRNAAQISTDFGVSQKFSQVKIDEKAKVRPAGTCIQIKIKKEEVNESSKQIKTGDGNKFSRDVKAEEIHCKQDLDCTPAERNTKRYASDFYPSDVERATKKRLLPSKEKPVHQPQPKTGSGSLCIKAHGIISSPVRKFGDLSCTSLKKFLENRAGVKNINGITHETMDRSSQDANDILQEAEKLKKLADCLKSAGFDYEYKEVNFNAALMFLLGASLLEMSTEETAQESNAFRSCAHQYETNKEIYAAALAYKCIEVACMRVVYCRSLGLSGEWGELHKMVQMTPQGESPSSSASDVDSFCHQGVIDKSAKTKRGLSHGVGTLLPIARNQQNFVPLLEVTESMNLAMEASAKSQHALGAVTVVTSEETKQKHCVSAIKEVVNFSFHDVEALIQKIEVARDVLCSSKARGP